MDDKDEILVLVFDETLGVGEGVLVIEFSGILNEHLTGFYTWCLLFPFILYSMFLIYLFEFIYYFEAV